MICVFILLYFGFAGNIKMFGREPKVEEESSPIENIHLVKGNAQLLPNNNDLQQD